MTATSIRLFAAAATLCIGTIGYPTMSGAGTTHAIAQKGQAKGQAKGKEQDKGKGTKATPSVVVVDRDGHQRVVRDYVTRGNLPPGLAKRQALPPGLAKQLHENGELPPGLQQYITPIPQDVVARFPAVPAYYHRYFAGNDFVVVDTRTNRIVLLIRDLLQ